MYFFTSLKTQSADGPVNPPYSRTVPKIEWVFLNKNILCLMIHAVHEGSNIAEKIKEPVLKTFIYYSRG